MLGALAQSDVYRMAARIDRGEVEWMSSSVKEEIYGWNEEMSDLLRRECQPGNV